MLIFGWILGLLILAGQAQASTQLSEQTGQRPGESVEADAPTLDAELLQSLRERSERLETDAIPRIPRIEQDISLSGELDDPMWEQAVVWELPYEIDGGENRDAPMETYVLMASSGSSFYVAFVSMDREYQAIRSTLTDRDQWSRSNDDAVGLYIDTHGDARNAYYLMANAHGVQRDALRLDRGGQGTFDDDSFAFIWHTDSRIYSDGYIVEIELPFDQLRTGDAEEGVAEWGIMPFRVAPRDFSYEMTPFAWDFDRNCYLCQFPMVQVDNPDESFSPMQFVPYVSGIYDHPRKEEGSGVPGAGEQGLTPSAGLDFKYQTSNWVFDATVLPDFSQVEADEFQMDTNVRFDPTLEERRPFFMERTDLLRFPISGSIYTRSLLDPSSGLRWTGKSGPHNWMALGLHDQSSQFIFPGQQQSGFEVMENVDSWNSLFRYRNDISEDAVMGLFMTNRQYDDGYNHLISGDAQYSVTPQHTLVFHGLGSWNRYPSAVADVAGQYGHSAGEETMDYGYLVRLARSGRNLSYRVEKRDYGHDLITGMGDLQRVGIRRLGASPSYTIYPDAGWLRDVTISNRFRGILDRDDWSPLTLSNSLSVRFSAINRTNLSVSYDWSQETFRGDTFNLPSGSFWIWTDIFPWYRVNVSLSRGQDLDFRLVERMESFSAGTQHSLYMWDRRLQLDYELDYFRLFHDITAQEAVNQRLSSELQLTRRLAIRNIAQYRDFSWMEPRYDEALDSDLQTFENQLLLRYRIDHASAFYIGGFGEWENRDGAVDSSWQLFAKFSYML